MTAERKQQIQDLIEQLRCRQGWWNGDQRAGEILDKAITEAEERGKSRGESWSKEPARSPLQYPKT